VKWRGYLQVLKYCVFFAGGMTGTTFERFGVTAKGAQTAYFLVGANIFEKNRAVERLALGCARRCVVADAISWHLQCDTYTDKKRNALISKLDNHGRNELARYGTNSCSIIQYLVSVIKCNN
jgi:hypothetical protein